MSVYQSDDPAMFESALDSVLSQQLDAKSDIRVYLGVDGPIPDVLRVVVERYNTRIHRILVSNRNRGLAPTLNDLIQIREDEEFFFRMDADDISEPQRFARQLAYMESHPEVDILGTDIVETDLTNGQQRIVRFAESPEDARKTIARRVPVAHPTVCFRARAFETVGGYPEIRFNEDIAMWFACMKAGLVFDNLHEPLYQFSIGTGFWGRRSAMKAWTECLAYLRGIWSLDRLSWRYVFPLLRFMMRLLPTSLQRALYSSSFRGGVVNQKA